MTREVIILSKFVLAEHVSSSTLADIKFGEGTGREIQSSPFHQDFQGLMCYIFSDVTDGALSLPS